MTKKNKSLAHWLDISAIILLFFLALTVRFIYQNESIIDSPIRNDAREYYFAAYNLYAFNTYSTEPTDISSNNRPNWNFKRPPGYPFFLYPFIASSNNVKQFLNRTTAAQAIVGSLTVTLTYILSRLIFAFPWAFAAGFLTALSPHLIAINHFILSESLFTFNLVAGILIFTISWKKRSLILTAISGILFGYATLIRPVALLLGPFIGITYFKKNNPGISKKTILIQLLIFLIGYLLIYSPYLASRKYIIKDKFSISDQSIWGKVVIGSDIGLKNFIRGKTDPQLISERKRMTLDKLYGAKILIKNFSANPFAYIKWYLGGKIFHLWKWDNIYIGDVYQYPMIRKGFQTNKVLSGIHSVMHMLHWPLFILALISPAIIIYKIYFSTLSQEDINLIPLMLLVLYFMILLSILVPLPRYGIPLRPFVHILGIYVAANITHQIYCMFKNKKYSSKLHQTL